MKMKFKAVCAYFTPNGVVADSPSSPKYADYRVDSDDNSYTLYASSELAPAAASVRIPVKLGVGGAVFMNGFQSATESREYFPTDKTKGIDTISEYAARLYSEKQNGDYSIAKYKNKAGVVHGFSYCYFREGDVVRLFASLDESTGYTVFKYDAWDDVLKISKDIEGVDRFDEYKAMSLFYAEGSEDEVFDLWFSKLGISCRKPTPSLVGYSTKKLSEIDHGIIFKKLEAVKENFPVEPNIFIVDGRYCRNGDWHEYDEEKFPEGLEPVSDRIKEKKLLSGLTISPFTVEEDSNICIDHPEWLVKDENGRYFKTKKNLFVIDAENDEVRDYIRGVLHTILYIWGFDLVKLDNLYVAGLFPSSGKSRGEKMSSVMNFLRECCGEKLFYADHTPLMPAFGIADYCTVSCDAASDIASSVGSNKIFRESASVKNAAADITFRRGLDGRAFFSAPSHISLDDKEFFLDNKLNGAEQNVLTNIEGLFTSVFITTDSTALYNQKKKHRFARMCSLRDQAEDIRVKKTASGFVVTYKLSGRAYILKSK